MKLSIESEIKNAYTDVIQSGKSSNVMGNTLKLQQSSYEKLQARYKAGMITKSTLTQAEIGLEQTENSYNALIYDYNTRIMRFKNATGIGPGY
jgi:outer membrane protein TolC